MPDDSPSASDRDAGDDGGSGGARSAPQMKLSAATATGPSPAKATAPAAAKHSERDSSAADSDAFTREVIRRVQEDGTCWLSGTTWRGMAAMRISVSNASTTARDVERSVAAIELAAREP